LPSNADSPFRLWLVYILNNFFYQFNGNLLHVYTINAPKDPANVGCAAAVVACLIETSISKAQKKIKDTIIEAEAVVMAEAQILTK